MDERNGTWRPGAIVWRELATSDLDAATAFYEALFGWTHHDSDMGEMGVYRHFKLAGADIGAAYKLGPHMAGVPSHWMHYISVDDVDKRTKAAQAAGAQVHMGPMDIPNVGRATYLADPQGGNVALFRDGKGDAPAAPPPYPNGAFCWSTLSSTDPDAALKFYTEVVGMGGGSFNGIATLGTGSKPEDAVADIEPVQGGAPSHWMSHVVVGRLEDARDRAVSLGAMVLADEIAIPTVGRMAVIADPTGAVISLFEPAPR